MKEPIKMLDINDPDFNEQFREALGLKDGDTLQIVTPQFTRTNGIVVTWVPKTVEEYEFLKLLKPDNLIRIGCQRWSSDDLETHWLYPSEWYHHIPDGFPITSICGETKPFVSGETSDDIRFGALAYGFIQPNFRHDAASERK